MNSDAAPVCFYCGSAFAGPWDVQHDHFPLPKRRGGGETVPACVKCHHLKDRTSYESFQDEIDIAIEAASLPILETWNEWLSVFESSGTRKSWHAALEWWMEWPPTLRIAAARLMAWQAEP